MTSATMRHHGAAGRHAEGRGLGMVVFAGTLVALVGFFNLLDGIVAIAKSSFFIGGALRGRRAAGLGMGSDHLRRREVAGGSRGVGR
ncbi:MAG TPA: hypothetical protein VFV73_42310 [Streptosporangiaceae bacterium]|nr:hypothetical protein [Streptosporangiaceae bacterium]